MKRTNQKTFLVINNLLKFNDFATATTRKTVFWGCVRVEHVLSLKNSIITKKKKKGQKLNMKICNFLSTPFDNKDFISSF